MKHTNTFNKYFPTLGMSVKEITEHYLCRFKEKFKDKYDYSLIDLIPTASAPIQIICKKHGVVTTSAGAHLKGCGCSICGKEQGRLNKRYTHLQYMKKVNELYPERSWKFITNYEHNKIHIFLYDEIGFIHKILPSTLLSQKDSLTVKSAIDKTSYIRHKFNEVHRGKYTYDNFIYKGTLVKSTVTCKKHGDFEIKPSYHLGGMGCRKCFDENKTCNNGLKSNTQDFIEKCKKVHPDKYEYHKVDYVSAKVKVTLICKIHGEFQQIPNSALCGYGCPNCVVRGYKREQYIKRAKGRKTKVYLIKIFNETEEFYKVGITYKAINKRYGQDRYLNGYSYETLYYKEFDAHTAWNLEKLILNKYHSYKYSPKTEFHGKTECMCKDLPLKEVIEIIQNKFAQLF